MRLPALAVLAVLLACKASSPDLDVVRRSEIGDAWPLTVEEVQVECLPGSVLLVHANGKRYALNGTAMGMADERGYADIEDIWAPNPDLPGTRINIRPIFDRAEATCR